VFKRGHGCTHKDLKEMAQNRIANGEVDALNLLSDREPKQEDEEEEVKEDVG